MNHIPHLASSKLLPGLWLRGAASYFHRYIAETLPWDKHPIPVIRPKVYSVYWRGIYFPTDVTCWKQGKRMLAAFKP
jgi:hypothetical protein